MALAPVPIPRHRVQVQFSRSGGPGGQNVNKVETKAEIRFVLWEADWIPGAVRARLAEILKSRLTNAGEVVLSSSEHRSQAQNVDACFDKLEKLLARASVRPRRRIATQPTRASKRRRSAAKRLRSKKKQDRGWRDAD